MLYIINFERNFGISNLGKTLRLGFLHNLYPQITYRLR